MILVMLAPGVDDDSDAAPSMVRLVNVVFKDDKEDDMTAVKSESSETEKVVCESSNSVGSSFPRTVPVALFPPAFRPPAAEDGASGGASLPSFCPRFLLMRSIFRNMILRNPEIEHPAINPLLGKRFGGEG